MRAAYLWFGFLLLVGVYAAPALALAQTYGSDSYNNALYGGVTPTYGGGGSGSSYIPPSTTAPSTPSTSTPPVVATSTTTNPTTPTTPANPTTQTTTSNTTGIPSITTSLTVGSVGDDVVNLQKFLIAKGYLALDTPIPHFGNLTRAAVEKYQCDKKIVCSGSPAITGFGNVGPKTLTAIALDMTNHITTPTQTTTTATTTSISCAPLTHTLYLTMQDSDVTTLQNMLIAQGLMNPPATGYFGPLTKTAVISFQLKNNLIASDSERVAGYVGPGTRAALNVLCR